MSAAAFWLAPDWGDADMAHWPPYQEPFWMREPYREPEPPKPVPAPPRPRVVIEPPSNRFAVDERKHAVEWACNQVLSDPLVTEASVGERVVHVSYLGAAGAALIFNVYMLHREIPMSWTIRSKNLEQYQGYRRQFEKALLDMPYIEIPSLVADRHRQDAVVAWADIVERSSLSAGTSRYFGPT